MLETAELLKKVRKLEIVTGKLVADVISGAYHSVFKGRGIEFDEVREYTFEDDVRDIMEIREKIEGLASYYATLNMTPEGLKELAHIVDLMDFYYEKQDTEHLRKADDDFHECICRLSKRSVIKDTLVPLHRKTRRYRKVAMEDRARASCTLQEHHQIFDAIAAGNADLARDLSALHIVHAKVHMFGA